MKGLMKVGATMALLALPGCASTPEGAPIGTDEPATSDAALRSSAEGSAGGGVVAPDADSPALPAFYSAAQAVRGKGFFRETCLSCHSSSEFRGSTFERQWRGRTVRDLYASIAFSMPDDNPGGLPAQTYTDIIAYVLELNGYPPGASELMPDRSAMRALELWPEPQAAR